MDTQSPHLDRPQQADPLQRSLPYLAPYALFGAMTLADDWLPDLQSVIYIAKVVVVGAALWLYRKAYPELRASFGPATLVAALVGVLVIVAWVGLDPYYPQSTAEWRELAQSGVQQFAHAEKAEGQFDPYEPGQIVPPLIAILFRVIGAVLVVPIFEELFVRSWLIRFLVREDFEGVPMGAFTWLSFIGTVALFGLTHHEWLAGIICGIAFNLLLYWRRDIFQCVVAHAVANLALAIWVLTQGAWGFW